MPYTLMRLSLRFAAVFACCAVAVCQSAAPAPHARVQSIASMRASVKADTSKRKSKYTVKVEGSDWVDTGVPVMAGDVMDFSADGALTLSDGRKLSAAGTARGWRDMLRQFPMEGANVGAVVGRISNSPGAVPFLIGDKSTVTARQSGQLYVRTNVSSDLAATGSYSLKIEFNDSGKKAATAPQSDIATRITAETFDPLPRRVTDQQGNPGDVVNFALVGTEQQVKDAFAHAGWVTVDKSVQDAIVNGLFATLQKQAYLTMPMSTLYLFGRPQDMSYARADAIEVAAIRHHLRVWKTDQMIDGKPLWVGSATHDNGFEKDQRNGQVTHHIDANIDEEREFIHQSFDASGAASSAAYVTPLNPISSAKTATGGEFHTDGRILVMELN